MTKHTDLIARLEALTVPDRKVDAEIGVILHIHPPGGGWLSREYTGSIDAAVALCERVLPDVNCWGVEKDERGFQAYVSRNNVKSGHWLKEAEHAASPSIALLISTLKALDAKEQS